GLWMARGISVGSDCGPGLRDASHPSIPTALVATNAMTRHGAIAVDNAFTQRPPGRPKGHYSLRSGAMSCSMREPVGPNVLYTTRVPSGETASARAGPCTLAAVAPAAVTAANTY